jgi:hypothetical protein
MRAIAASSAERRAACRGLCQGKIPAIVAIRSFSENRQTLPSLVAATAMSMTPGRMQGLFKEKIKTGMFDLEMKENSPEG